MKYVLFFVDSGATSTSTEAEEQAVYGEIMDWFNVHGAAGRIVGGEELQGVATATTVRFVDGRPIVSDGPYIEAKEVIGGYAVVDVPDLDAALEMAKSWPARSVVEVRPVVQH